MAFIFYPTLLLILQKSKSIKFFKAIAPAQLLAFSTSSSAATLPVTMECVTEHVGVDEVSSFVLPLELLLIWMVQVYIRRWQPFYCSGNAS
jgi:Na+/H+-dicarboxylate symporter